MKVKWGRVLNSSWKFQFPVSSAGGKMRNNKILVLIIEDSEETAKLISINLTQRGMETIIAKDGVEGMKLAREHHPDFITIDILMPNMSGVEVIEEIQKDNLLKNIPFATITNVDDVDLKHNIKSKQPPPKIYLLKPVNFNNLGSFIKKSVA